jgi:HSP90 family molecular chaperone
MHELPTVTNFQCRFDAFGEIYDGEKGDIQLTNYVNIAKKNSRVNFVLWSRNYKKIEKYFTENMKPNNFRVIRSSAEIDKPVLHIPNKHIWDGVFNVLSAQYMEDNNVKVNCGTLNEYGDKHTCVSCPTGCYHDGVKPVVFEQIK